MLKRTIASFVTIAALSSPAIGAQFGAPGESGFYGGLGLGQSKTDVNAGAVSGDDNTNAWKGFAGYQFNRYFAVEGGYLDLGSASIAARVGRSTDNTAWQASLVGSLPMSQQFAFIGKLGVARTDTDTSGIIGGVPTAFNDRNTDATYGLGLRYDFNKKFGVRGEWDRFRTSSGAFGKGDADLFSVNGIYRFY